MNILFKDLVFALQLCWSTTCRGLHQLLLQTLTKTNLLNFFER